MMPESSRENVITFPDTSGDVVTTTTMPTRLVTSSEYRIESESLVLSANSISFGKPCAEDGSTAPFGSFSFTGATDGRLTSSARRNNSFVAMAAGGFRFVTGRTLKGRDTGAVLQPNASSWAYLCDRDAKKVLSGVNNTETLEKLISFVPAYTWRYSGDGDAAVHMGPLAQDFYDAFGLGVRRERIEMSDIDGVLISAVLGMKERVDGLRERVGELEMRTRRLQQEEEGQNGRLQAQRIAKARLEERAERVRQAARLAGLL